MEPAAMTTNEFGRLSMSNSPQQQQQQQPQSKPPATGSLNNNNAPLPNPNQQQPQQLHPEIRSIIQLSTAHAHKVYFSGQLVKHVERQTDGRVVGKDEPWRRVWGQLGGTTLSLWDMEEIEEASKRGAEAPPSYLNVTDAVSLLCIFPITPTYPNQLVRTRSRFGNYACPRRSSGYKARERHHTHHRWNESSSLLMCRRSGAYSLDSCLPSFSV